MASHRTPVLRSLIGLALIACALAASAAATTPTRPPGGPAPAALTGTWHTTLVPADVRKLKGPPSRNWLLVITNANYLSYPHALGFGPVGDRRDTVLFGVSGHKLYLGCLDSNGSPAAGHATYRWTVHAHALHFTLLSEPCHDPVTRDRIVILTSHSWNR